LPRAPDGEVSRAPTGIPEGTRLPFVVVTQLPNFDWQFATLADAVTSAWGGSDVIEIRGNGPFVCDPITIYKALTIRAGSGFRPVLLLSSEGQAAHKPLLTARAPLVLEGLDLQLLGAPALKVDNTDAQTPALVGVEGTSLHVLNCGFGMKRLDGTPWALMCVAANKSTTVEMRNCERLGSGQFLGLGWLAPKATVGVENCLIAGDGPVVGCYLAPDLDARISVRHCTLVQTSYHALLLAFAPRAADLKKASCQVESTANVFVGPPLTGIQLKGNLVNPVPMEECKNQLHQLISWSEEENLYAVPTGTDFFWMETEAVSGVQSSFRDMRAWEQFWELANTRSYQQPVQFK